MNAFVEKNVKWIFSLPAVIFVFLMIIFPLVYTIYISTTDWDMSIAGSVKFTSIRNYIDMFRDKRFTHAFFTTFYFTALAVAIETVLGIAVALVLNREFYGKNLVKLVLVLPMVTTPAAIGLASTLFYEPTTGLGNYLLKLCGVAPSQWLASNLTVLPSLVSVDVWEWTPMIALIVLAGLPQEPYEAAIIDGATKGQTLVHITLPLLSSTIRIAVVLRSIDALKTFDIIYAMTGGGPGFASETLNIYAYNLGFGYFRFGAAAAVLVALFVIVLASIIAVLRMRKNYDV